MKKVALVTGASSGIGRMITRELNTAGFQVYAAARRMDCIADLKAEGIMPVSLDLTVDDVLDSSGRIAVPFLQSRCESLLISATKI